MRYEILTVFLCATGLLAIAYGMLSGDDFIFLVGLPFVVGGYLLIRRKLKESLKRKNSSAYFG